jgi:hypothetical protein
VLDPLGVDLDARGLLLRVVDPDLSIARPSRLVRESATTMRYCGLRIFAHPQKPDAYGHCVLLLTVSS